MNPSDAAVRRSPLALLPAAQRDRRPLRYRIGTVVHTGGRRVDLACGDGRVHAIRLADRTLYTLGGHRLSGPEVLHPGVDVRIASVDSSRGATAVLVELLPRGRAARSGWRPALLPARPDAQAR